MKLITRTAVLALAIMMLTAILVLPASATLNNPYYSHVCDFHELYNGSPENAYIRAAQSFLWRFSTKTKQKIESHGGIDGGYGDGTEEAVVIYQTLKWPDNNNPEHVKNRDGRVGRKTWTKMAEDLVDVFVKAEQVDLCFNGQKVMMVNLQAEGYTYYNYNELDQKDRRIVQH